MKRLKTILLILSLTMLGTAAVCEDEHDHSKHAHKKGHHEDKHDDHDKHEDHDKHIGHDGHDDHNGHVKHKGHSDHKEDHSGHDHGGGKAIGKGKAITDVNEKKGFRLSKEAIKTLKLRLKTVEGDEFEIPKSTLITSKKLKGIYRFKSGYFKLLPVKIKKETKSGYLIHVKNMEFGDQVVINGVGLLRVSDIYSTDKSEYGHAH